MKVQLSRPLTKKVSISSPVRLDMGNGQVKFMSASPVESDAPSSAYKQQFSRWQREERGN